MTYRTPAWVQQPSRFRMLRCFPIIFIISISETRSIMSVSVWPSTRHNDKRFQISWEQVDNENAANRPSSCDDGGDDWRCLCRYLLAFSQRQYSWRLRTGYHAPPLEPLYRKHLRPKFSPIVDTPGWIPISSQEVIRTRSSRKNRFACLALFVVRFSRPEFPEKRYRKNNIADMGQG